MLNTGFEVLVQCTTSAVRFLRNFHGFSQKFEGVVGFWLKTTLCAPLEALIPVDNRQEAIEQFLEIDVHERSDIDCKRMLGLRCGYVIRVGVMTRKNTRK